MAKINLEELANSAEMQYADADCMIEILEECLGKSFEEIKKHVNELKVTITVNEIKEYLEKRFSDEEPEVKERIESKPTPKAGVLRTGIYTEEEMNKIAQDFEDELISKIYKYNAYSSVYFNNYIDIVRNKANRLLGIIEALANKDSESIKREIKALDINIDSEGKVLQTDIYRLVCPTLENIKMLEEKVSEANQLESYVGFKKDIDTTYRNGGSEDMLYPVTGLQFYGEPTEEPEDCVRLSDKQKAKIQRSRIKSSLIVARDLTSLK